MTLLSRFRERRKRREDFYEWGIAFFSQYDTFRETLNKLQKAAESIQMNNNALSNYLFEVTRQAEASRKVLEIEAEREIEAKPSKYDRLY